MGLVRFHFVDLLVILGLGRPYMGLVRSYLAYFE